METFQKENKVKRYKNNLPKIGIRPVIDGRRGGVRESLEEQTMNMAKNAARFLSENIFHSNGTQIECVIPNHCIGGNAEAAEVAEKFKNEGVEISLTVTPCWCYGLEVMDSNPAIPKAVWGFNGTERPGAVYLAAALAGYSQMGLPIFGIYGKDVQDSNDTTIPEDVKYKLLLFANAALAAVSMKDKTYLSLGSVSMGIAGSIIDTKFLSKYLGIRTQFVDMTEIIRRINEKIYDEEELEKALVWKNQFCNEGNDRNKEKNKIDDKRRNDEWEFVIKMTMIIRDMMIGNSKLKDKGFAEEAMGYNAVVSGFQGQRHWTDHYPNGDFSEAILNSSFDWNGIRAPYLIATENDHLNGISMLFGNLLTNTAQIFADVRTFWSNESVKRVTGYDLEDKAEAGIIHLINSGSATLDGTGKQKENGKPVMKPWWEISSEETKECLDAVTWYPSNKEYFRGGGFSSNFLTESGMPLTIFRINIIDGLGPVLQIAEGFSIELPQEVHKILDERTDPTWPTTWFVPILNGKGAFKNVYSVMANWGANHCVASYGHIGDKLITLASMLRIPVNMHNVEEERIFRPSAWNARNILH